MEAFAAFRSSQLQPPRAYLLDPSAALPHTLELSGEGEGSEEGAGGRELKDLILVSIYVHTCTVHVHFCFFVAADENKSLHAFLVQYSFLCIHDFCLCTYTDT